MFQRIAIVAALLLPFSAAAQVLAPAMPVSYPLAEQLISQPYLPSVASFSNTASTIPVWASPDGRLLALVSMSQGSGPPALQRAPLMGSGADWRIIDATSLLTGAMRLQLSDGVAGEATVSHLRDGSGCGTAGSICSPAVAGGFLAASLGLNWSAPDQSTRLGYGVSWLRDYRTSAPFLFDAAASSGLAGLPYSVGTSASVFARGQFMISDATHLDVGLSHGTAHQLLPFSLASLPGSSLSTEQSTLSFGVGQGSLRGSIIGRVVDSVGSMLPGRRWTLLDFGVSWRTPWQGELSLGTQSYLAPQAESPKRDADVAPSRVPYVQYRQDL